MVSGKTRMTHIVGLLSISMMCEAADVARAAVYYVSTEGSDSWSGTIADPRPDRSDGPFATLQAGLTATRSHGPQTPRRVVIAAGRYFIETPVVLTARDSYLTIEAPAGQRAVLYGGRQVTGWRKEGEKFYAVSLPGVKEGDWDFRTLVVNGRYCRRARLPETGTFEHASRFDVSWMTTTGGGWQRKPTNQELTTLKYRPQDIGPWLDPNNAEVTVYHMWDESLVGVAHLDTQNHTMTFRSPAGHPAGAFGVKKYVVWNVREGMTEPGQWYLDRTAGKLVYWPLPGEDMSKADVIAPVTESILRIEGTKDKPARSITIRNVALSATTTPLGAGGFGAGRFQGAISATSAEDCKLLSVEVFNAGGQGLKVSGHGLKVERCHVHHVGACGIRFAGEGLTLSDNHVHDVGLTYPSAIAMPGGGQNHRIVHNHIHHCPYSAINCGGQNNRIERNLIHHAMQELHDGAGIYCFAGKDLILRGNFIRDIVDTGGYGASAYYLDERSENCLVEGNLSLNVVRPSHNHMAKNNTIRNNVFISSADARLTFPRSTDFIVEKNVIWAKGKIIFENADALAALRDNVLFSQTGQVEMRKMQRYSQTGQESLKPSQDNPQTDPKLIEYFNGRVRFGQGSPATELGIEPIDVSDAGPRAATD